MQAVEKVTVKTAERAEPMKFVQRLGSTTYKISVHFSETSKETMGDKILRLIRNEAANI
ncbi:MAG: transposon-encoded TnpW family protein [Oscillospiraceae bacterium]|jgi:hypothetical protein|nr:transposon-encoded TnpW family protein [Oscillospiraceae bacterium]